VKKICDITPGMFEDHLILSLSTDWLKEWKEFPQFSVGINSKGKLVIESKHPLQKFMKVKSR